jgi:hypothetical protein
MPNIPWAQKSFWMHQKELPDDVGLVESHFSPFGDGVSVHTRYVHGLHQTYDRPRNRFGCTRLYS